MHPTCYSYWLANSFSQFLPLDACASVDVLNLYYCIIALLYWIVCCIYPYSLQWVLVISILLTSLSARVIIILYCWFVLHCIKLCYCIYPSVYSEYRFHSSPHPHVCLCVCISLAGRTIYLRIDIVYCYLHIVYYYLHHCVLLLAKLNIHIDIICLIIVCFPNSWGRSPLSSIF